MNPFPPAVEIPLGLGVIVAVVFAIIRRVDVRLTLVLAALALATLAGQPAAILRMFLITLSNEKFVVPICTAMGFAFVLKRTGCDQHLVQLLVKPLRRVRPLLVPGTVCVGFCVNIPIISQTSTAVAIGSVLVPLLRAARISPLTTGAALLLGSSIGGELLNPGAPELRTISAATNVSARDCVGYVLPLILVELSVATFVFWLLNRRAERDYQAGSAAEEAKKEDLPPIFRVNLLKALVPLVPLLLLFFTGPPLQVFDVPRAWLVNVNDAKDLETFDSRLIGSAMLIGVAVAALTSPHTALGTATAFFEGAGYGFTHPIALIVAATCFGKGVELIGIARLIGALIEAWPALLLPIAGLLPLGFALLSGSGMATTQSLFGFFVQPANVAGVDPAGAGAVVALAAAGGRTISPVAAVTLMCGEMAGTNPIALFRRLVLPVLAGVVAMVIAAWCLLG